MLAGSPPGRVHRGGAGLPEHRIELDVGNAGHVAELPCQGRLARAAPAEDDHFAHAIMMPAAPQPPDTSGETASAPANPDEVPAEVIWIRDTPCDLGIGQ